MTLKHTLKLLTQLEAEGKLVAKAQDVETLYDPNHLIHLTVQATGADVRDAFLAAVIQGEDAPEPEAVDEFSHEPTLAQAHKLAPKAAKLGGKKGK